VTGKHHQKDLMRVREDQRWSACTLKGWFEELNGAGMIPVSMIHWQLTGHAEENRALQTRSER
jgi:hypothetical protein